MSISSMENPFCALVRCPRNSSPSPKIPPADDSRFEDRGPPKECEEEVSSSAIPPRLTDETGHVASAAAVAESNPTVGVSPSRDNPSRSLDKGTAVRKRSKRMARPSLPASSSSSSFVAASSSTRQQKGAGFVPRRRNLSGLHGPRGGHDIQALALPLGMSIAAVVSQVLDRKDAAGGMLPADHLSMICTAAVKESVASVFGARFDGFVKNFETSFGSTLKTLRFLNQLSPNDKADSLFTSNTTDSCLEAPPVPETHAQPADVEAIREDVQSNSVDCQLILHGCIDQQLASLSQSASGSGYSQSVVCLLEKSVMEQGRSNDLKTCELMLVLKRLGLEESQLALLSDANSLERCKISMGISKASFRVEKLKTQLEDTRHTELLKKCIDCLVAGLLIMSACLIYAAYVYSYQRIVEAADFCTSPPKESKSRWIPNPMSSVTSGFHMLKCHATALSRMLFGVMMILALAYSLLQRSVTSRQNMPVTIILLLLGVACGFFGKLCVDTLGGSGYCWLLHWEALCLLHFFANTCTPSLFRLLHGPISVSQGTQEKVWLPYWIRRVTFYGAVLFFLPVLCGLMPFASPHEWKEHFSSVVADKLLDPVWFSGRETEL